MQFKLVQPEQERQKALIKVVGVGGGGGNAVKHMIQSGINGVHFICLNTDRQHLEEIPADQQLAIGVGITRGLGAGSNPDIGRKAAQEDREAIREAVEGADMLFVTAGMGGGTGTGAAPVVAQIARELGILTVAVVTRPFTFEGTHRARIAGQGLDELREYVDSLITVPNDKLISVFGQSCSFRDAFKAADDVLLGAVQGIAEMITRPGLINLDFADVRTVMSETGMAMIGSGHASGEDRAVHAAEAALSCPLLDDINLAGARGMLVNVTAGSNCSIGEWQQVGERVREHASEAAQILIGMVFDDTMHDELRVTVVATGLGVPAAEAAPGLDQGTAAGASDKNPGTSLRPIRHPEVIVDGGRDEDQDYLDIPSFLRRQAD